MSMIAIGVTAFFIMVGLMLLGLPIAAVGASTVDGAQRH